MKLRLYGKKAENEGNTKMKIATAGASGAGAVAIGAGAKYSGAFEEQSWENVGYMASPLLSLYGIKEVKDCREERKEYKERGEKVPAVKWAEWFLRSAPIASLPIAILTKGNAYYSLVLPGVACVAGHTLEAWRPRTRSLLKDYRKAGFDVSKPTKVGKESVYSVRKDDKPEGKIVRKKGDLFYIPFVENPAATEIARKHGTYVPDMKEAAKDFVEELYDMR